jgi:TrmH family RNA methyltransferase
VELLSTSESVFRKLAFGDRIEGIVAVIRQPRQSLASLRLPASPLVVVLEGVEKPGNLGAVLRTADGAGTDAVIVADARTDLFNPNVIRASTGTAFSVPVAVGTSAEVHQHLVGAGVRLVAARPDAPTTYTDADLTGPLALILGTEATGLTGAWSGPDVTAVRLPMRGVADSLNVSIAAAILLYEAARQRQS